ncbi:CHAT domain protein [Ceratobasidium sp. AG-Ba]|nr:CHAT domain protein [Ceratobasidium sp. AG-Ba]
MSDGRINHDRLRDVESHRLEKGPSLPIIEESAIRFLLRALPETHELDSLRQLLHLHLDQSASASRSEDERIDSSILLQRQAMPVLSSAAIKATALRNLAQCFRLKYKRFGNFNDLDQGITCLFEATVMDPEDSEQKLALFGDLGYFHHERFRRTGQLETIDQALQFFGTATSLASEDQVKRSELILGQSQCYLDRFYILGELPHLETVISLLSETIILVSEDQSIYPQIMNTLGSAYAARFSRLGQLEDIDMALGCKTQAIERYSGTAADRGMWLSDLAGLYFTRFERLGQIEDTSIAIKYQRAALALVSNDVSEKTILLGQLGEIYSLRFERTGQPEDFDQAIECLSQVAYLTPQQDPKKLRALMSLAPLYRQRFLRDHNPLDLVSAIDSLEEATGFLPVNHPNKPATYSHLGDLYHTRYEITKELADLDKEIEYLALAIGLIPKEHPMRSRLLMNIATAQELRYESTGKREDLDKPIAYYQQIIQQSYVPDPLTRFEAASSWAKLDSSSLEPYEAMVQMLPQLFWLGSLDNRCYEPKLNIENITTQVVAAAIAAQSYETALQWFDICRLSAWQKTLQLRGKALAQLRSSNQELARNLENVARELNQAPMSNNEQAAMMRRQLALEWDSLLTSIRLLPGLEGFLMPKKPAEILRAARFGAVVLVNMHESRCDALTMRPDQEAVSHVSLPSLTVPKVLSARSELDKLIHVTGNDSNEAQSDAFEGLLRMLWDDVVQPVLDHLGYIVQTPDKKLPHITWCVTGPLAGFPLHAAGRYEEPRARTFSYAVSSYTPNLSALLVEPADPSQVKKILFVGQAAEDTSIPERPSVTELVGDKATPQAVLHEFDSHTWVHLACHISQSAVQPAASVFRLHGGDLTLAEILGKQRNDGGIAFLSRCAAAERDTGVPAEGFPVGTGMIMAGFSTVFATLWVPHDAEVAMVTRGVYARLLDKDNESSTKLADSLHHVITRLRNEVGEKSFARWVPFVHIGL